MSALKGQCYSIYLKSKAVVYTVMYSCAHSCTAVHSHVQLYTFSWKLTFQYLKCMLENILAYQYHLVGHMIPAVAYPEIFFGGGLTNSVDRGQREQGSGGGSPLVRGSAQFANR
jgi:hypothetical protein